MRLSPRSVSGQRAALLVLALPMLWAGIGLRDPWPPDEPRFALLGRDLLAGAWNGIVPLINGEVYAHKPPFYLWLQALAQGATGSLRWGFLLPSLLCATVVLLLVHDLAWRWRGPRAALASGLVLLCTVQFVVLSRSAQIDMTLCACTTLGLYGLLRRCVLDGSRGWWLAAWAAMGLGVIAKGVGFLPLLMLLPIWLTRRRHQLPPVPALRSWDWVLGPAAMAAAIGLWLGPLLWDVVTTADPGLRAYAVEVLFGQTAGRYVGDYHRQWIGYYLIEVIPVQWLPAVLLLPWLIPAWWRRIRRGDGTLAALLGWILLVVLFFTCSTGKREVYLLPALPALALAVGPLIPALIRRRRVRVIACPGAGLLASPRSLVRPALLLIGAVGLAGAAAAWCVPWVADRAAQGVAQFHLRFDLLALAVGGLGCGGAILAAARPLAAWVACTAGIGLLLGCWVWPVLDAARSAESFMGRVESLLADGEALGILPVKTKEQLLLHARRPVTTFGYELGDTAEALERAAAWLDGGRRCLLMDERRWSERFPDLPAIRLGFRYGKWWVLVRPVPGHDPAVGAGLGLARRRDPV